jgi:hypothetical protein
MIHAVGSMTTDETQVPNVTGCYAHAQYNQQIRAVNAVGTSSSGVPWFVGSTTNGVGLGVQTDTLQYYIDHGRH